MGERPVAAGPGSLIGFAAPAAPYKLLSVMAAYTIVRSSRRIG